MPGTTIDQFFTPTSRDNKRQRPDSSPESSSEMDNEKVGEMTHGQLMAGLSALLDSKNLATKDDLSKISRDVETLAGENAALKSEVMMLREQEKVIMSKLLDLEGRSRRNNLIFRGLPVTEKTRDFTACVRKFCSEVLGSSDTIFVNRAHPLGRDRKTVIAHIPCDTDIDYIMSRVGNLKGTGYVVHRDYPREVRQRRSKLAAVRAEIERVAGRRRMRLTYDHLMVEGCRFTWEEGQLRAGQQDGVAKLISMLGHDLSTFVSSLQKEQQGSTTTGEQQQGTRDRRVSMVTDFEAVH